MTICDPRDIPPRTYDEAAVRAPRIVVDPGICFGEPHIDGTRVPVHAVVDRFVAGEDMWATADDFAVSDTAVFEALRFGLMTRCQRQKYLAGADPFTRSDAKR